MRFRQAPAPRHPAYLIDDGGLPSRLDRHWWYLVRKTPATPAATVPTPTGDQFHQDSRIGVAFLPSRK